MWYGLGEKRYSKDRRGGRGRGGRSERREEIRRKSEANNKVVAEKGERSKLGRSKTGDSLGICGHSGRVDSVSSEQSSVSSKSSLEARRKVSVSPWSSEQERNDD